MIPALFNKWERERSSSVNNVELARGILFLLLALVALNLILTVIKVPMALLIYFLIYFPIYFFIRQDMTKDFDNLIKDEFTHEIDVEQFNVPLKDMINEILERFKIQAPIHYYIGKNNFDYSPHVFSRTGHHFLIWIFETII
ncbi:MAG: hypothetical protein DI535_00720 [Citrobacter freundii]|nr:MAG: hypothetical protein DI535_00720 [Citrobacter freundii]